MLLVVNLASCQLRKLRMIRNLCRKSTAYVVYSLMRTNGAGFEVFCNRCIHGEVKYNKATARSYALTLSLTTVG